MDGTGQRRALERLIIDHGEDYAGLSRLLGKNPAYIQQFIKRGSPRRLAEEDCRTIAQFFGVAASTLGIPAQDRNSAGTGGLIRLDRLQAEASAGGGAFAQGDAASGGIAFDAAWLRSIGASPDTHKLIAVLGESMEPTLSHGDQIMVDSAAAQRPFRAGIPVIRLDGTLMVKRLALAPGGLLSILSDNAAYPSYDSVPWADVEVIGRVVWAGRRF